MIHQDLLDIVRYDKYNYYCPSCSHVMKQQDRFSFSEKAYSCNCEYRFIVNNYTIPLNEYCLQFSFRDRDFTCYVSICPNDFIIIEKRSSIGKGLFNIDKTYKLPYSKLDYSNMPAIIKKFKLYMILD